MLRQYIYILSTIGSFNLDDVTLKDAVFYVRQYNAEVKANNDAIKNAQKGRK